MSEVNSSRAQAELFFSKVFAGAKSGALFLYVDNNNSQFYSWFDELARTHSLSVLQHDETWMYMNDYSEEKKDLAKYWEKFGNPKIKANIAFRICRKN